MKKKIRKELLAQRDGLPPEQRSSKSRKIEERLFALPEFRAARVVMFFASFRSEVETLPMIRRALAEGKRVVLPKVAGRDLALFEIRDVDRDVQTGTWGIPEPVQGASVAVQDIDFLIVPGAVFDERGNRLGYGAGYYDRILSNYGGPTTALAFEIQVVSKVPVAAHDVPVQKIVTERRVIAA